MNLTEEDKIKYGSMLNNIAYGDSVEEKKEHENRTISRYFQVPIDVSRGLAEAGGNAVSDIVKTTTDLGMIAGIKGFDLAANLIDDDFSQEGDADKYLLELQNKRDEFINYIETEDGEDDTGLRTFVRDTGESIFKFAFFYNALRNAGVGTFKSAVGAGFGEGFTDDPERDTLMIQQNLENAVAQIAPDKVDEFKTLMDTQGDSAATAQLFNRFTNGLAVATIAGVTEKAAGPVGAVAGVAGKKMIGAVPEPVKEKTLELFSKTAFYTNRMKNYIKSDRATDFNKYVLDDSITDIRVTLNNNPFDPAKTFKQNFDDSVSVSIPSGLNFKNDDIYTENYEKYVQKLDGLIPEIRSKVVDMSKARGISEKEALSAFAKEVGAVETKKLGNEGYRNVLRAMAHNELFETQIATTGVALARYKSGYGSISEAKEAVSGLLTSHKQVMSLYSGTGRTLRASQATSKGAIKMRQQMTELSKKHDDLINMLGDVGDDEAEEYMLEQISELFANQTAYGADIRAMNKTLNNVLKGIDTKKTKSEVAKEFGDKISKVYTANILSAPVTLAQQTIGAYGQMGLHISDMMWQGAQNSSKQGLKSKANSTLASSYVYAQTLLEQQFSYLYLAGKSMKQHGIRRGIARSTREFSDRAPMPDEVRNTMLRKPREEISSKVYGVEAAIDGGAKEKVSYYLGGDAIYGYMQGADMVHKTQAANAYIRSALHNAFYIDDVFDLASKSTNPREAARVLDNIYMDGRLFGKLKEGDSLFTADEKKLLGMSDKDLIKTTNSLLEYGASLSKEAADHAAEITFTKELGPGMEKLRKLIQDDLPFGRILVAPFFSSPVNIIDQILYRMPIIQMGEASAMGLPMHPRFYKDIMAGGETRNKAIGRLMTGITAAQIGYSLAEKGIVQYTPADIPTRRTMDQFMNIQPGSITIGDSNIPLAQFGPVGSLLAYGANLHNNKFKFEQLEHLSEEEQEDIGRAVMYNVASFVEVLKEAPYMMGVDQLIKGMDVLSNPDADDAQSEFLAMFTGQKIGNMAPYSGAQRQINNMLAEERTRAQTVWEHTMQQFAPYLNWTAADFAGNPLPPRRANVVRYTELKNESDKELYAELFSYADLDVKTLKPKFTNYILEEGMPGATLKIENEKQWNQYLEFLRNENVVAQLRELVKTDTFKANKELYIYGNDSRGVEANRVRAASIINSSQKKALDKLIETYPELRHNIKKEQDKKLNEMVVRQPLAVNQQMPTFMGD